MNVIATAEDIDTLVDAQLAGISDADVVAAISSLRVRPAPVSRAWEYGAPGQRYVCWTVLEHITSGTGIVYCGEGFGPSCPWGLVPISGPELSIGDDSGWYTHLEDAFRQSCAWDRPNPPGYEVW